MKVWFVGAGPGDPELLTIKAHRLLSQCQCCIWAGSLVNPDILKIVPDKAAIYDSAKLPLDEIIAIMSEYHSKNTDVIRLHTGEPSLFGAIGEQIIELEKLGIDHEIVPGISSFQASAAIVKTELTMPDISQTVIITRTEGRTPMPSTQSLEQIGPLKATLCIFLSIDKIDSVLKRLAPFYGESCPAVAIYHASWPDQKVVRGTIENLARKAHEAGMSRTGMILVGEALGKSTNKSKLYDSTFSHGFRKGSE
jgi:precorrin-4/cobalt-precorrin-4 C11-methyltransferase